MAGENTNQQTQRTAADIEAELMSLPTEAEIEAAMLADAEANPDPADNSGAKVTTAQSDDEALARRRGWQPKEEFKGDTSKWVDAKTFLERGDNFTKTLRAKVESLEKTIASFEGTKKAFAKFHAETVARKDAELKAAIDALRVQRSQAQTEGDHETAVQIEDRIDELQAERKAVKAIDVEQDAPADGAPATKPTEADTKNAAVGLNALVMNEWIEDGNAWFKDDPQLQAYAVTVGEQLVAAGEKARGRKFLDLVAAQVRDDFPRKFREQQTAARTDVVAGGKPTATSTGNARAKTEADLPPEDLKLMRQFIKEGWTTKEAFLQSYFSR